MHRQLECIGIMNFNTRSKEQREHSCFVLTRRGLLARINPDL